MTKFAVKSGSSRVAALAGCLATLAGFVVAAQFPHARLWGINWWSYIPALMGPVIVVAGGISIYLTASSRFDETDSMTLSRNAVRALIGMCALALAISFWLFRNRVHFLGDGYQLLSALPSAQPYLQSRNFGPMLLPYALMRALGGPTKEHALLAYQLISVLGGCLFMLVAYVVARMVTPTLRGRVLMWLGVCTGGYMLLFYGYVENYALFIVSVLAFCWAGVAVDKGRISRWWLLPAWGLTVFFHVFGLALLLPTLYQFLKASPPDSLFGYRKARIVAVVVAMMVIVVNGVYVYLTNLFVRFAFVPVMKNALTVESYTLFSANHLLDWLNLVIMVVPGIVLFALVLGRRVLRQVHEGLPGMRFLLLTALILGSVCFFINPLLGMPRDWDLFSAAGVPLTILLFYSITASPLVTSWRVAVFCIILDLLLLGPRVASQAKPEVGLDVAKRYVMLDKSKNLPLSYVVVEYVKQAKGIDSALALQRSWSGLWPDDRFVDTALALTQQGQYDRAASYYQRALSYNPMNRTAWGGLGNCLLETGRYDSAATILKVAAGLNPQSSVIASNLAYAYFYQKEYVSAEHYWREARFRDTSNTTALVGLASLYDSLGDDQRYAAYFDSIVARPDAPPEFLLTVAEHYIKIGHLEEAAAALKEALMNGLDSSTADTIVSAYPGLRQYF